MGRGLLIALVAFGGPVWACEPVLSGITAMEQAVLEARLEDLSALRARVDASLGCGPPMEGSAMARLWLAEGAALELGGDPVGAAGAFLAAWRADPELWNPDLGPTLFAARERAVARGTDASGRLVVRPGTEAWVIRVDGNPTPPESVLPAGLHLVQVHPPGEDVRFGAQVVLYPGQRMVLDTGLPRGLPARGPTAELTPWAPPRGSRPVPRPKAREAKRVGARPAPPDDP